MTLANFDDCPLKGWLHRFQWRMFTNTVGPRYNSPIGTWKLCFWYQGYLHNKVKSKGYNAIGTEYVDCYIKVTFLSVGVIVGFHCKWIALTIVLRITMSQMIHRKWWYFVMFLEWKRSLSCRPSRPLNRAYFIIFYEVIVHVICQVTAPPVRSFQNTYSFKKTF